MLHRRAFNMALENFRGLKKSFWDDRKMLQVENFREGIFTIKKQP
jgi:hypothetical protein